jgi:hypothetical protein
VSVVVVSDRAHFPTLRQVTKKLRHFHEAWSHPIAGGEFVHMVRTQHGLSRRGLWWPCCVSQATEGMTAGYEYVPGDWAPFDAVAAARRLLSHARCAEATRWKPALDARRI